MLQLSDLPTLKGSSAYSRRSRNLLFTINDQLKLSSIVIDLRYQLNTLAVFARPALEIH